MALAQSCKNALACFVSNQIPQLFKGRIDQWGVNCKSFFPWLELHQRPKKFEFHKIKEINPLALG
jgi:hypothetical protein